MNAYDVVRFFLVGLVNGAVATRARPSRFGCSSLSFRGHFCADVLPHTPWKQRR